MFEAVPKADAYSLKMILHDWNDTECIKILSNIRKAATAPARQIFARSQQAWVNDLNSIRKFDKMPPSS
jgi:hypothetical protein